MSQSECGIFCLLLLSTYHVQLTKRNNGQGTHTHTSLTHTLSPVTKTADIPVARDKRSRAAGSGRELPRVYLRAPI